MPEALVVHAPAPGVAPSPLVLFFHGVGSDAPALAPLARWLAPQLPGAALACVPAPWPSDLGAGRQWFSVRGVTEENRPQRVAPVLPVFEKTVRALQAQFGATPASTVLVGFSQGGIMALESARAGQELAARVVSLAGRFAQLPDHRPEGTAFHFLHGSEDGVMPVGHAREAAERLRALGAQATLDVLPATGHEVTPAMAQRLLERLR